MQLAAGHDLSVSFVTRQLFSGLDFSLASNARVGLVGMNGCGKTTLFRVMNGELAPDTGQVIYNREARLAYMEQFLLADEDITLYQAVLPVFAELIGIEEKLTELNQRLEREHTQLLLLQQQQLQERYADAGGYTYAMRLRSALLGLGFSKEDFQLPVRALSGGQRSKAALAKVLLSDANLLLLDEPTNHLDIASIEWLESYLATYRGAFIIISHDRYFLDQVTNETWALEQGSLRCFPGNYSAHLLLKESEDEAARRIYQNRMREIRRIEGIIEQQKRFNQARNYLTIASKQKQISRLKAGLVAPQPDEKTLAFRFSVPPAGGNDVLELVRVAKGFDGRPLFANASMHLSKGEKVFLLGPNGCGKTTLMRIICGELAADTGAVRLGVNIFPRYYDQIQNGLRGSESVLRHMTDCYPRLTQTRIHTVLGSFLFSGESVEKILDALSGGEKARLELLKLMLEPANLLLLDEPTNHLDIASREAVENALLDYPGTVLAISHDRYLINRLADRIYYLSSEGLAETLGNYDDYLLQLQQGQLPQGGGQPAVPQSTPGPRAKTQLIPPPGDTAPEQAVAGQEYRRRKEEQAESRRLAKKRQRLWQEMWQLEAEIDLLQEQIDACAPEDYQLMLEFFSKKEQVEEQLLANITEQESLRGDDQKQPEPEP
jgi:ATP-binding cassette, subfamily F, member 3